MSAGLAEIRFYHLQGAPLTTVLPVLVQKSLERGWRVAVQAASAERVEAIDALLWTHDPDSFIPHGADADPDPELQPVFVTRRDDNPNGAQARILVDGVRLPPDPSAYERVMLVFDGADPDAVEAARADWKSAKALAGECSYWRQDETGRWERQA